jgi:hypothetical protein
MSFVRQPRIVAVICPRCGVTQRLYRPEPSLLHVSPSRVYKRCLIPCQPKKEVTP